MKQIPLTQGKFALVDDEDFEHLNKFKWCAQKSFNTFYAITTIFKNGTSTRIIMAREIMNASNPKIYVDHKDRNGLNNQKSNLRLCTNSENQRNSITKTGCSSKYRGVIRLPNGRWKARIRFNSTPIHLGYFNDEKLAAIAYNEAAIKYHGEFATINTIE